MSTGEKTAAADAARLRAAPRCGARTRAGTACRSPAVHGRARCRMHGCGGTGRRSGAPRGNRNAWKDGYYAAAARARRRETAAFIRDMEACVAELEAMARAPDARDHSASTSGAWGCFPLFPSDAVPPHRHRRRVPPGPPGCGRAWRTRCRTVLPWQTATIPPPIAAPASSRKRREAEVGTRNPD